MNNKNNEELLNHKRNREKEKLITDIQTNFKTLEDIFKTEKAQNIFNSIGSFSFEEYSKFFQNLSNKEYTSMTEHPKKNRDPISIDKSKLKFDYALPLKFDEILPSTKDILKSNLLPKGIPKSIKENLNKIVPKKENIIGIDLYLRAVSENISNLINSRSELEPNDFKQLIKLYSIIIRSIDKIYFEQDKYFLELLEKYLDKSYSDFFNLSSYWLYTEFLLCSDNENNETNRYKRYDEILRNIIQLLYKLLNNNNINIINYKLEFNKFISNVPIYNKIFIDFIIKFHKLNLDLINDESIKGLSILGGEPLHPKTIDGTLKLAKAFKERYPDKDIWLWTGFLFEEVMDKEVMKYLDTVVDGQYVDELHDFRLKWRGSSNQRVIDVAKSLKQNKVVLLEGEN